MTWDSWTEWHNDFYNNSESDIYKRNEIVKDFITEYLKENDRDLNIISVCSGQARDILPTLVGNKNKNNVYLIDTEQECLDYARKYAEDNNIQNVHYLNENATILTTYENIPKADLLIFCGALTTVHNDVIGHIANSFKYILKDGGEVIWSRHTYDNNYSIEFNQIYLNNGYECIRLYSRNMDPYFVCRHKSITPPDLDRITDKIFDFSEFE